MATVRWWGYVTSNFGDALTPWMIRKLGHTPVYVPSDYPHEKVVAVGSILGDARPPCIVWGTGVGSWSDPVHQYIDVRALRGPLTWARVKAAGIKCPTVYGDPALLLPRLYQPKPLPRVKLGIVPHFLDQAKVHEFYGDNPDVRIVDLLGPIEDVIDGIAACDKVLSSSLHGLVVAAAYGVPFGWAKFGDTLAGDGIKFRDFYLSVGLEPPAEPMLCQGEAFPVENFMAWIPPYTAKVDTDALWDVCPFK